MTALDLSYALKEQSVADVTELTTWTGFRWTLLDHVARYARDKGIKLIESIESRDNVEAIALEKEMGFSATAYPEDATLVLVQKRLD